MKSHAEPVCCALLAWLIIMLLGTVRLEIAWVQRGDKAAQPLKQIPHLELMPRDVEECHQAEKSPPMLPCLSRQSRGDHAAVHGKLMNRVFDHLAGTAKHELFITEYRTLIQRTDYGLFQRQEPFAEYMRQLESGQIRLLTRLKEPPRLAGGFHLKLTKDQYGPFQ